ncbi:MAG: EamA family transporter [Gammaproteobacteria bacterium]|nr:MAG: EamA family transporter [Gammaproteobacteria bacterium]
MIYYDRHDNNKFIYLVHESIWAPRDTLIALVVVLIWGINFVPMKYGLEALTPLELGVGRYFFAAVPLLFFIRFPNVRGRWVVAIAVLQAVGQFSFLFYSMYVGMTASLASVLLQTQVFFTALWSFFIFKHKPSKLLWVSMSAATIGLAFFAVNAIQSDGLQNVTLPGLMLILASGAMWGAANIVSRQAQNESPHYNALSLIVWSSLIAVVLYVLLIALFSPTAATWLDRKTWSAVTAKTWLSVAFLGWASSVIGYALWTTLLKRHAANRVAPFSLGVPVIGLAAGLLWLGEPINVWQWLGSGFIGLSLVLVVFGPRWFRHRKTG